VVSKGSDAIVLYPTYFDVRRSQRDGRRVPRKLAVENPTAETIAQAAKALGYRVFVDKGAAHPTTPWRKDGRVLVTTGEAKSKVLRQIAAKMRGG
jgi:signal recognition particle subunit SRP19